MSTEDEVREASIKFYAALNRMANGTADPLADIWSHSATVTTMHPIGGLEIGWEEVRKSFEQVAHLATAGEVKLNDQIIQVAEGQPMNWASSEESLRLPGSRFQSSTESRTSIGKNLVRGRLYITTLMFLRRCSMLSPV
jgi:hypothetical protein